ncbi:MAG: T9SS type A sorting domain-containing protein [Chlorobi bacterium]|nr:T9SS type A sorting domain-containing protein [Chlorobiota bacterium]
MFRRLTYGLLFVLSVGLTYAQDKVWQTRPGGKYADYLYGGLSTLDNGFLLLGGSVSPLGERNFRGGGLDGLVIKLDEEGMEEWVRLWGGEGHDVFRCGVRMRGGGYLLAGESDSDEGRYKQGPRLGGGDIWLVVLDDGGRMQSRLVLGGGARDYPVKVLATPDGGYVLGGVSYSDSLPMTKVRVPDARGRVTVKRTPGKGHADFWVVKLDEGFHVEWERSLGGVGADVMTDLSLTADGKIVAGGYTNSPELTGRTGKEGEGNDWWVVVLSPRGEKLWARTYGGRGNDELYGVAVTEDGEVVAGGFVSDEEGRTDLAVVAWDVRGRKLWERTYDRSDRDILRSVTATSDGGLLIGGYARRRGVRGDKSLAPSSGGGTEDFWVIKTDGEGRKRWEAFYGTRGRDILEEVIPLRDGGYVLAGTTVWRGSRRGDADFLVMKIADREHPPRALLPLEAVPNPAGDVTQLVMGRSYARGEVLVTDLDGRVLQRFEIDGSRIIPLNLRGYRPGIYIVAVKTDDAENSIKIIKE